MKFKMKGGECLINGIRVYVFKNAIPCVEDTINLARISGRDCQNKSILSGRE